MLLQPVLTGCNGIFADIYDEAPDDSAITQGFIPGPSAGRFTLKLDATAYDCWHFIDLHRRSVESLPIPRELTGEWDGRSGLTYNLVEGDRYTPLRQEPTDAQPEPEAWDLAIHHFDVRTNGALVLETDFDSLDGLPGPDSPLWSSGWEADSWSTTQVITDLSGMLAYHIGYQNSMVSPTLCRWVEMDISTPPPTFRPSGRVYLLRMPDGTAAALHLAGYMSPAGTKGHLTIDFIYPW